MTSRMGACWSDSPPVNRLENQAIPVPIPVQTVYSYSPSTFVQQPQPQPIQIFVRTLTGLTFPIVTSLAESVYQLKQRIQYIMNVPPERQRLLFMGKELFENQYLYAYQLQQGVTLHLVLRLS